MIVGYYIATIDAFHQAGSAEPFQACAHHIDETHVILWARFQDHGHEQRFLAREGVEALPDPRRSKGIHDLHADKLAKYGVRRGDSVLDVSDRLAESAGHCMRLPHF